MPPVSIRRPLTVTTWLLLSTTCLAISPALLALAGLVFAVTHDRRPLIFTRLLMAYCAYELGTLVACGVLWLVSGAGKWMRTRRFALLHWRLLRWFVRGLARQAISLLELSVVAEHDADAENALAADGPLLVFSRHAGPADTVLIADQLLSRYDRRPSVVFKETVAIDPCIDLLGHRLPHAVLDTSDRDECETRIAEVTERMDERGVLLLFPEGGNFTHARRRAMLQKLRLRGRRREAARAEAMPHVLPPHATGVLTALGAGPRANVLFAAHTGLGLAAYPREMWRNMPIGGTLRTRMWLVPASDIPRQPDAQTEWLYDWWQRIDTWVADNSASSP
jgi:1-acyl-sn-glycerol-3-phosphate acyltransferase